MGTSSASASPVFVGHGVDDGIVPLAWARQSVDWLGTAGHDIRFETYPIGHAVCADEVDDLAGWIESHLR